jgi:hypothetical protein
VRRRPRPARRRPGRRRRRRCSGTAPPGRRPAWGRRRRPRWRGGRPGRGAASGSRGRPGPVAPGRRGARSVKDNPGSTNRTDSRPAGGF